MIFEILFLISLCLGSTLIVRSFFYDESFSGMFLVGLALFCSSFIFLIPGNLETQNQTPQYTETWECVERNGVMIYQFEYKQVCEGLIDNSDSVNPIINQVCELKVNRTPLYRKCTKQIKIRVLVTE